jgi:thiol-disulfide isomerase/thioredoxin
MRRSTVASYGLALCTFLSSGVAAQTNATNAVAVHVPPVALTGLTGPALSLSAPEAVYHEIMDRIRVGTAIPMFRSDYPKDSVLSVNRTNAQRWFVRLRAGTVRGLHIDSYGVISVAAGQEGIAQQHIAARLATAGLSVNDRAHTYLAAVTAFTDPNYPQRLPIAERYVEALDRMKGNVGYWQGWAHRRLMDAYYELGRKDDVIRHGTRAMEILPNVDFVDRTFAYGDLTLPLYTQMVDALAGRPDAAERVKALSKTFLASTMPSSALIARDSAFYYRGISQRQHAERAISTTSLVGARGADLVSNYWINWPVAGSVDGERTMRVDDGKIRIVEFGSYTCPGCVVEMTHLQQLQDRYPDIQVVTATWTVGSWGLRLVDPDVEAQKLHDFYTQRMKIRYPIAIWKGRKVLNEDGGMTPENEGPNLEHYPMTGKPNTYVLDGKGIVRRLFVGFSRETEKEIAKLVEYLQHESK